MLIQVTIQGTTPIMFDRFHAGLLEAQTPKTTNRKTELTPLEQATLRLYIDPNTKKPFLPQSYLLSSIINAGRFIKIGKRQLSTRDETIVTSFLSIPGQGFPIRSREGWRVDGRGVVNQVTKARVMAYRPMFDDWEVDFTIDLDESEGQAKTVRELVDRAGRSVGMGVMRPQRKGSYGQSKVISWVEEVQPVEMLEAAE